VLILIVVEGEAATYPTQQLPAQPITVLIVDRANRPVPGAIVTFTTPATGAGGDFDGSRSLMTFADENGRAVAAEYHPNSVTGSYQIEVLAVREGERAVASIQQRNAGPKKSLGKVFVGLAIAGAAAAAVATLSGGGGNNPSTPTTPTTPTPTSPTISFGGATVGGPTN
jgi:hypothetical protein